MAGLENAHILRPGYAIEYDYFDPSALKSSFETRQIAGLFFAGLPPRLRVGLGTFDRATRLVASPTDNHALVARGLRSLTVGPGTATGEGIFTALDAIASVPVDATRKNKAQPGIVLLADGAPTVVPSLHDGTATPLPHALHTTPLTCDTPTGPRTLSGLSARRCVAVPAGATRRRRLAAPRGAALPSISTDGGGRREPGPEPMIVPGSSMRR